MRKPGKRQSNPRRTASLSGIGKTVAGKRHGLDITDVRILQALQEDCRRPLETIARNLHMPKSTVGYRVRRLERTGIVEDYFAKLSATKLGKDYLAVVLVRGKYGTRYRDRIGRRIGAVPGVWAVYYVLGDTDFVLLIRANDREDYLRKLETISDVPGIERTSTQVVAKVFKEDPRILLG